MGVRKQRADERGDAAHVPAMSDGHEEEARGPT